jgi:hypothetical protein
MCGSAFTVQRFKDQSSALLLVAEKGSMIEEEDNQRESKDEGITSKEEG